jgi:hypothetical protein
VPFFDTFSAITVMESSTAIATSARSVAARPAASRVNGEVASSLAQLCTALMAFWTLGLRASMRGPTSCLFWLMSCLSFSSAAFVVGAFAPSLLSDWTKVPASPKVLPTKSAARLCPKASTPLTSAVQTSSAMSRPSEDSADGDRGVAGRRSGGGRRPSRTKTVEGIPILGEGPVLGQDEAGGRLRCGPRAVGWLRA